MIVEIEKEGKSGIIIYNKEEKEIFISFPDTIVSSSIWKFLREKARFRIPIPAKVIGAHKIVDAFPYENIEYLQYKLSELYGNLGVWVDWDTLTQ